MTETSAGEIIAHFDETEQRQAGIMRAILSTELDRWEQEKRHLIQHPQARQYALEDQKLEIPMECDWFYIYSAKPAVDHFEYYPMEKGAGYQSIIPRNVKRFGPVRTGIVLLPVGFRCTFWIVWGIGTKDSNLSFEYRQADENFAPQSHFEQLLFGPIPIFPEQSNARIQIAVSVPAGGGGVYLTDPTGFASGLLLPAGTVSWIDGKAASDIFVLKPQAAPVLVNGTAYNVVREFPNV
jgi:hypothetical protein